MPGEQFASTRSSAENAAVAIVCGANGAVTEVIYDELRIGRLEPGRLFSAVVAPFHARKADRFLRVIRAGGAAFDWELICALAHGAAPIFFSGSRHGQGFSIVGTKDTIASATSAELISLVPPNAGALAGIIEEIRGHKEDRSKAERQLKQHLSHLNEALAGAWDSEQKALPAPASRSRHLRLLEIATHDLRNPISGVLAATQYLIEDAGDVLEPHHMALLQSVEASARLMLRLLQDMTEIPAIALGKVRLHLQPTDLGSVVEHAVAGMRTLAENRRVTIATHIHKPLPMLPADPARLTHALESLLASNIRSSQAGARIEIQVSGRADQLVVTLRHAGGGQPSAALRSLFERTPGASPKRALADERAALTLAHLKRIIEAHNGTVRLESGAGEETSVVLTFTVGKTGKPQQNAKRNRKTGDSRA